MRLQQSIEELRAVSGQDSEEEKVGSDPPRSTRLGHVTVLNTDWLCLCCPGEEAADRQTVQRGQRETAEDPPAHGDRAPRLQPPPRPITLQISRESSVCLLARLHKNCGMDFEETWWEDGR